MTQEQEQKLNEILDHIYSIRGEQLNQGSEIQKIKNAIIKTPPIKSISKTKAINDKLRLYLLPLTYQSINNFIPNKDIFDKMAGILNIDNIPAMSKILVSNGYIQGKRYIDGYRYRGFYLKFTSVLDSEIISPE